MNATTGIDAPKKPGDAGYDLRADTDRWLWPGYREIFLTAAVEIPDGYCGLIIGRSSLNINGIYCVFGLIDSGYRGVINVVLWNTTDVRYRIQKNDRIAQLVLVPYGNFPLTLVDRLTPSERGDAGFGSTGS